MITTELNANQNVYVAEAYPKDNFSNSSNLFISRYTGLGDVYRTLLQFNLPANTPDSTIRTIESAYLQLTVYRNEIPSGSINASVYRALNSFYEWNATWNTQPSATGSADGTVSIASGYTGVIEIDISGLVKGWYDGSIANNGIVITGNEMSSSLVGFRSTRYPDSRTWPKLIINHGKGKQTIYPTETIDVPVKGSPYVYSTPVNVGEGKKEITYYYNFSTVVNSIGGRPEVSVDGINYNGVYNGYEISGEWEITSFAVPIESSAPWARTALFNDNTAVVTVSVTPVTWED